MKDGKWQLLAKLIAHETNSEEEDMARRLLDSDKEFQRAFYVIEELWDKMDSKPQTFDKERIIALMEKNIRRSDKVIGQLQLRKFLRYAAIFIGVTVGLYFLISDLNQSTTINADNSIIENYKLPDGSTITLNKGASINYPSSRILGFTREVTITKGEAFFEIAKLSGKGFIVRTPDYDVNVLGTKFDINISKENTSIVLTQGSVKLNHLQFFDAEMEMIPGNRISCNHNGNQMPLKQTVNTSIYTLWTKKRLEFKNFTMKDMEEVFNIYFNKTLIFNDRHIERIKLGGSAPLDDLNLIIKGLSTVLKREIINKNDSIIIN